MTTIVTVTNKHIDFLIKYMHEKSKTNLTSVLNAIRELGNPRPNEIKKFLDEMARKEAEEKFKEGRIEHEQIEATVKELTMDIRTILRKLKELTQRGWIEHKDYRYSLAKNARFDIRFYADTFGIGLNRVMFEYIFSRSKTVEIEEFVKLIGAQVFYTFLEASYPIDDDTMSDAEKDEFVLTGVKNAIPIEGMYYRFIDQHLDRSSKKLEGSKPRFT
ncbi:MAG: hypothetical protein WA631_11230, partial [Nitrososphaeraceae archaeon]